MLLPSTGRSGLDHDHPVVARFAAPEFTRTAVELTHIGVGLVAREHVEPLGGRIEANDGVGGEVGEPDLVLVVHKDGVGAWALARQLPCLPRAIGGIVHRDMAAVPLADPDPALRVRPDAPRALAG